MQAARAVAKVEGRHSLFIQFTGNNPLNELIQRLLMAEFHHKEIFHRTGDQIPELITKELRNRTDDINLLLLNPTSGMLQHFTGEVANQVVAVFLIHDFGDGRRNIRYVNNVPIISFVSFIICLLFTINKDVTILGKNRAKCTKNLRKHTINPAILIV
ncbi:hypothetical protein D3C76_467050 [compost metagenome]